MSYLSVLVVVALVVGAGQALADGTMTNNIGTRNLQNSVLQVSVDIEDYLSVYRFETAWIGSFDVALFDQRTPLTVDNFRGYADRGDYVNTFIHRSVGGGFGIVQGGGFAYTDEGGGTLVPSYAPVLNEPGISNTVGTLALAKQGGDPNSGTNQWYVNTSDNSAALDPVANNGGFTVFGEVLYDGMNVVGLDGGTGGIADLPVWDASGWHPAFTDLPLEETYDGTRYVEKRDLVTFDSISQVTGQSYQVTGSSDPSVATGSFTGSSLTLDIAADAVGSAELTIRTTDAGGQWFDTIIIVDVAAESADFDGDGDVDADDLDTMMANLTGAGVAGDWRFDFDCDGDADRDDLLYVIGTLVQVQDGSLGTTMGDLDLDGVLDENDLDTFRAGFGGGGGWVKGDLNGDGLVDATDLAILASAYDNAPVEDDVPEPATLLILTCGGAALLRRRRK
jgi:peptidyl-prolyl cis-trans isomerase A (cyclophilin A)